MAKLTTDKIFTSAKEAKETALDKTTRIVRQMTEDEAEKRQIKTKQLRLARLEKEANISADPTAASRKKSRKTTKQKATNSVDNKKSEG